MIGLIIGSIVVFTSIFLLSEDESHYKPKYIPPGTFAQEVRIETLPTDATIYVDDRKIGKTPLKVKLWHGKKRALKIKAVPYKKHAAKQYTQYLSLPLPNIPKKIIFYMNHPSEKAPIQDNTDTLSAPINEKIIVQEKIIIQQEILAFPFIYFDFDNTQIQPIYEEDLNTVATWFIENVDYNLFIHGHADEVGENNYNIDLSLQRSNAVKDTLINLGLAEDRMQVFAHGKSTTIDATGSVLEASINRKVSFQAIKRELPIEEKEEILIEEKEE